MPIAAFSGVISAIESCHLVGFGRLERAVTRRSTLVGARPPEDTCLIEREKVRGVDPDQWTQWARIQLG
jgi:hypothetical protein